jgi:type II secretory pathway pseudopilin PulG
MKSLGQVGNRAAGYAMAALLVAIAVLAIGMTVALPAWRQAAQREKEAELVFRGQQYVRAIQLFQRKFAAAYPPSIDVLVSQKFLRKKYQDPMVEDGEFEVLYQGSLVGLNPGQSAGTGAQGQRPGRGGASTSFTFNTGSGAVTQGAPAGAATGPRGGMIGVRSKSTAESIRIYNGATHYNDWLFIFMPALTGRGRGGGPGLGPGRGPGIPGGAGGGPYGGGQGRRGGPGGPRGGPGFNQ